MGNQWDDKSWQKDSLNMKSHSTADAKLSVDCSRGFKDAYRLGALHVEHDILKKKQEE